MTLPDLSPAGELTIGQVGIANLRVRSLDIERLAQEMRERIERAPAMFSGAAVVVDFGGLADAPSPTDAAALLEALRGAGVRPVALAYGSQDNQALAGTLGLPTLAKFRARYERAGEASTPGAVAAPAPAPPPPARGPAPPVPSTRAQPGLVLASPVRSGQQVYADGRDLTILGVVSPGAEVMADGSVHVYGALRGRALAGAQGDTSARIFCQSLQAELVAIAGHYIVAEEVPMALLGKPAQVWLEDAQVRIAALD